MLSGAVRDEVSSSRSAGTSRRGSAAAFWSTPPGSTRRRSRTPSTGYPRQTIPPAYFCRGVYFTLTGRAPFQPARSTPSRSPAGLGVHITLDLAGQARFGPDVEWISSVDYAVDPARGEVFYGAVRTYWPGLPDGALQPGYAGIRPKISGPTEPAADFVVQGPETHRVPGSGQSIRDRVAGADGVLAVRR